MVKIHVEFGKDFSNTKFSQKLYLEGLLDHGTSRGDFSADLGAQLQESTVRGLHESRGKEMTQKNQKTPHLNVPLMMSS